MTDVETSFDDLDGTDVNVASKKWKYLEAHHGSTDEKQSVATLVFEQEVVDGNLVEARYFDLFDPHFSVQKFRKRF